MYVPLDCNNYEIQKPTSGLKTASKCLVHKKMNHFSLVRNKSLKTELLFTLKLYQNIKSHATNSKSLCLRTPVKCVNYKKINFRRQYFIISMKFVIILFNLPVN